MDWPPYAPTALRADSVREFCDWNFLSRRALDSRAAALDYFCLSPFYAEIRDSCASGAASGGSSLLPSRPPRSSRLLNERIRMGESLNLAVAEGLLFRVVEDNLEQLNAHAPAAPAQSDVPTSVCLSTADEEGAAAAALAARRQYFATKALFVLTLSELRLSVHGMQQQQAQRAYAIVGGRVYRLPPLMQAVMQRVGEAASHLSSCGQLLLLQLCRWDVSSGYAWEAPLQRQAMAFACEEAGKYFEEQVPTGDSEEKLAGEGAASQRVQVVYCKPQCNAALRVLTEESQRLAAHHRELQVIHDWRFRLDGTECRERGALLLLRDECGDGIQEQRDSLEGLWKDAAEQQENSLAQLQALQNKVSELRAALLQQASDPQGAAELLETLANARVASESS